MVEQTSRQTPSTVNSKNKSFITTILLATFFGILGFDRFYLRKNLSGLIKLVTLGGLGFWAMIDWLTIISNHATTIDNQYLEGYSPKTVKIAVIIFSIWVIAWTALAAYIILQSTTNPINIYRIL